jgi:uncharacterized protein YjbJ (UPF0337 family)
VSITKSIRHKTQTAKGKTQKVAGRVTGNRRLKAKGRAGQARGGVMQAADRLKGAFEH